MRNASNERLDDAVMKAIRDGHVRAAAVLVAGRQIRHPWRGPVPPATSQGWSHSVCKPGWMAGGCQAGEVTPWPRADGANGARPVVG
jgi:hypothetical protein